MRSTQIIAALLCMCACSVKPVEQTTDENGKILFVVSNAHYYGSSDINAANHFAEIVLAYDVLWKAGYVIDFVSPEGGAIPVGYINTSDSIIKKYLYDGSFMDLLESTKSPEEIKSSDYKAVYYSGGGSAMFGVFDNQQIQKVVMDVYEQNNGIVSAVCHGTAGIVNLQKSDGTYLVSGKRVNGFPDLFENMEARYYKEFPFSIQNAIEENGGIFKYSEEGWDNYLEIDGRLITGQDPTSSTQVAEQIILALREESSLN
ncbi:MAG: type 1 glutamine amidotransferase domain-containing protein [Cyclobacteriaceae bacterium]